MAEQLWVPDEQSRSLGCAGVRVCLCSSCLSQRLDFGHWGSGHAVLGSLQRQPWPDY